MQDDNAVKVRPRAFISYSWDSPAHKAWVLQLATRLNNNGVDVILDQWDAHLGSDLPLFMEQGLADADRVLAITTSKYVAKANEAKGGVGYERRLLTADIMKDLTSSRIIPVMRDNAESTLPRFLGMANYVNFSDDAAYEDRYAELIHELHGRKISPRPPIGTSPFELVPEAEVPMLLRHDPARYVSPSLSGTVEFDHSNNDGSYTLGAGDMSFTLNTSDAGVGSVYVYNDPADIKSVAIAPRVHEPWGVTDATGFDASSRSRHALVGDGVVLRNRNDVWAVVIIDKVETRQSSSSGHPLLRFHYAIQPNRTADFSNLKPATRSND